MTWPDGYWGCDSFFFFKQKTAYEMRISDWSSDVCSSDLLDHVDRDSRFIINRLFPECRIKTKKASFCFVLQRSRSIINSIGPETILGESRHVHHLTEPCFCESHFKVFLVILNEFLQRPPLRPKWDNIT